jgi:hypothetical protein
MLLVRPRRISAPVVSRQVRRQRHHARANLRPLPAQIEVPQEGANSRAMLAKRRPGLRVPRSVQCDVPASEPGDDIHRS